MSQIQILGCSSGFCRDGGNSSSLLVDSTIMLDCGSGLQNLSLSELQNISTIVLSHSHLDHILYLPLLVDICYERYCKVPLKVYGLPETIHALEEHILNDVIWPRFHRIPSVDKPVLELIPTTAGTVFDIPYHQATLLPVNHTIPCAGIKLIDEAGVGLLFSGDTAENDTLWQALAADSSIRDFIVECTFPNSVAEIAKLSKHYHPASLALEIAKKTPF